MSHTVKVEPSGRSFSVDNDETVLDAALRQGLALQYGCRGGACGACKGKILTGEVRYDDEPMALSEEDSEEGGVLTCVAKASSDLVLELHLVEQVEEIKIQEIPTKIQTRKLMSEDVIELGLKLPEEVRLQYLAGQYVDFILADGDKRAFSIANAPHDDELLLFHIRHVDGGKFTDQLFNQMQMGERIRIEGPHGSFFIREDSEQPIIFLATGTGFGPVKAMVEHLMAEESKRQVYIYWGGDQLEQLYMHEVPEQWARDNTHIEFRPVLAAADESWEGRRGYVQEAVQADFPSLVDMEVYACGNPYMVSSAKELLTQNGLNSDHFFADAFELAAATKS